ncbi:MAG: endonuclease domain-containing protein [Planctomycetaceae bacterium]
MSAVSNQSNRQSPTSFRRRRRQNQTRSEGLLWSVLRARQVCGLKFRREHSIENWIVDFACVAKMLIVEIDGGYHDATAESDLQRQRKLELLGWTVLRFSDKDVEHNAEAVAFAIARELGLEYEFKDRVKTGSGMKTRRAPSPRCAGPSKLGG